jgi:hypothetical protein
MLRERAFKEITEVKQVCKDVALFQQEEKKKKKIPGCLCTEKRLCEGAKKIIIFLPGKEAP